MFCTRTVGLQNVNVNFGSAPMMQPQWRVGAATVWLTSGGVSIETDNLKRYVDFVANDLVGRWRIQYCEYIVLYTIKTLEGIHIHPIHTAAALV